MMAFPVFLLRNVSASILVAFAVSALPPLAMAQAFDPNAIQNLLRQDAPPVQKPEASPALKPDATREPAAAAPIAEQGKPQPTRVAEPSVPKPPPEELYLSKDPQPTFTPSTADLTEEAAKTYLALVEAGGWPVVPNAKLAPGVTGPAVAALKQRLSITGDLDVSAVPGDVYDATVEAAVRRYQENQGLEQTGAVGSQTLRALNVPAIIRYSQLLASAKRLRETRFGFGQRYVVVNIPSANVEAIEDGKVVRRYVAVVGKPDHPSPMEATKITSVNLNPTWTVPASIVKNEIIPHMQTDPGYLAKEHIRILDAAGTEVEPSSIDWTKAEAKSFLLRQDSGATNSLGTLRIDMPNKDAVYMHDTPSKNFFSASIRFLSHGCVRVSKVQELAAWLLENNSAPDPAAPMPAVWNSDAIAAGIAAGTRLDIKLLKPVPVAWVYLTGYATPDHVVHFRSDVYDLDHSADVTSAIPVAKIQPQPQPVAPAKASVQMPAPAPASTAVRID